VKKIHFATTNKGKIESLNKEFEGVDFEVVPVGMEIPEPRSDETKFISGEKVKYAFKHIKKPCIALDAGFYIPSLNGFPKAYVNFALDTVGIDGILKLVEGEDRSCEFRDAIAYLDETVDEPIYFETITKGVLSDKPRGELHKNSWSVLHKIFIPEGQSQTMSEMSKEEKDSWHESREDEWCGKQFAKWIVKR
jgi:XTP/dITP diphosphohydrolase